MKAVSSVLLAVVLVAAVWASAANATPPVSDPRRVVCVSAGNDGFHSGVEGYYRSLPPMGADSIQVGGELLDCLSLVRKGDHLVVIAHGHPGEFEWSAAKGAATTTYHGYGNGTHTGPDPQPLPPNLLVTNAVTVTLVGCHSANDPDGPEGGQVSVTQSLLDAMGGGPGNTVTGYVNEVNARTGVVVKGGTPAQNAAAGAILEANPGWTNNPPPNRTPPPTHSQKSAAEDTLAAIFPGKSLTANVSYSEPLEKPGGSGGGAPKLLAGPYCEGVIVDATGEVVVPGATPIGLVSLALLLATAAIAGLVRKRAESGA